MEVDQSLLERIRRHIMFAEYNLSRFERHQEAVKLANEIARLLPPDKPKMTGIACRPKPLLFRFLGWRFSVHPDWRARVGGE